LKDVKLALGAPCVIAFDCGKRRLNATVSDLHVSFNRLLGIVRLGEQSLLFCAVSRLASGVGSTGNGGRSS